MTAFEAAVALAEGVSGSIPGAEVVLHPVADGGDGTIEVIQRARGGELVDVAVTGPMASEVTAPFLWLEDDVAVIEMARASGLSLVPEAERDVMTATSVGTGELISAALNRDPRKIIVGLGGSATVDAGLSMMRALGVGFFAQNGVPIARARDLAFLESIDITFRDDRMFSTDIVAACDVLNPLLGDDGAARTFGPQKGASFGEVSELEAGLARFTEILMRTTGNWVGETPRGGAAGGIAAALYGLAGAELAPGFDVVADLTGFDAALHQADVLIVGEGSMDRQSLQGKAPAAAARRAAAIGVQVWAIAGKVRLTPEQFRGLGISRWLEVEPGRDPRGGLTEASSRLARQS